MNTNEYIESLPESDCYLVVFDAQVFPNEVMNSGKKILGQVVGVFKTKERLAQEFTRIRAGHSQYHTITVVPWDFNDKSEFKSDSLWEIK